MKIKQKIMCFISVLAVCIPIIFMFPFTASADTYNPPKSLDVSKAGYTIAQLRSVISEHFTITDKLPSNPNVYPKIYITCSGSSEYILINNFETEYEYIPLALVYSKYAGYQPDNTKVYFLGTYRIIPASQSLYWLGAKYSYSIIYSTEFIYFNTSNSNSIYCSNDSGMRYSEIFFQKNNNSGNTESSTGGYNSSFTNSTVATSFFTYTSSSTSYLQPEHEKFYNGLGLPGYPNFIENADMTGCIDYSDKFEKPLSEQVDVKLTPSFGLDMDRVFDTNTGQNDYFKFEVTNKTDEPIQFSASIVPVGTELYNTVSRADLEEYIQNNSTLGESFSDYFCGLNGFLNESALWNYLTDCEYYIIQSKTEFKNLYFSKDVDFYVEERKGNFYWIFLPPNSTYSDYIYWENVKITPKTNYEIVFTGLQLNSTFQHSSAVFVNDKTLMSLSTANDYDESSGLIQQLFKSNHGKPWTIFQDVDYDSSVDQYKVDYSQMEEIFRTEFSVNSIPSYTNIIKGGNSKITSGWSDTQKQIDNPYYIKDLQTGNIQSVSNWSEFNGSFADVDVDISNVKIDDVKGYITYSQDFFKLIKSVMLAFPSWVWVLICFGLNALIVIGIIKAIL